MTSVTDTVKDVLDKYLWWQKGIVYQIYPRSFQDADGDNCGDLKGITSRLDYLKWLGVDAIWISPIFPSPMKDFGYDVSNYTDIEPTFGNMADFDELLEETHKRGLKLILDFVPNHTSDHHPWFLESRSSRDNPKRDWYIWRDGKPGGRPPNNWLANFGGIAWTWDARTEQWYYHAFLSEQPDLNWRNPEVQQAMMDNLRFWLDKGVDGFRVDVMNHIIKAKDMPDNPRNPMWKEGDHPYRRLIPQYSQDQPEVHDIVAMMRSLFDSYDPPRVIIGEIYLPIERLVTYYGPNGHGAHLPFNFQLVTKPWDARIIASTIDRYEAALPPHAWPNWVLGNHDRPRIATRVGREQCRVAAMALLTLRGTPTMYYGDELGMQNVYIRMDQLVDPPGIEIGIEHSRDPERTPMQWDDTKNAGFTTADEPWLPVSADYKYTNVAFQKDDPLSTLNLYHRLIELRRAEPALSVGSYTGIPAEGDIVTYIREREGSRLFVALNFGAAPADVEFDGYSGTVVISTYHDRAGEDVVAPIHVRANEGVIIRLT
jgi:alpha-glucosidase